MLRPIEFAAGALSGRLAVSVLVGVAFAYFASSPVEAAIGDKIDATAQRLLIAASKQPAKAGKGAVREVKVIHEHINVRASSAHQMFRFKPNILRVKPGDTIRFVHTAGNHRVFSIDGMIPDGVKAIRGSYSKIQDTKLTKPGIYAFRCTIHGRFGMVMIVAVGDRWPNLDKAKQAIPGGHGGKRLKELLAQLEKQRR